MTNLSYYLEQKHPTTCLIDFHGANIEISLCILIIKNIMIYRIVIFFQVIGDSSVLLGDAHPYIIVTDNLKPFIYR